MAINTRRRATPSALVNRLPLFFSHCSTAPETPGLGMAREATAASPRVRVAVSEGLRNVPDRRVAWGRTGTSHTDGRPLRKVKFCICIKIKKSIIAETRCQPQNHNPTPKSIAFREASEEETFYGSTMGRRRGLVHISCELFLACVFVSSRDAPTLAITTTDLKPSGYPSCLRSRCRQKVASSKSSELGGRPMRRATRVRTQPSSILLRDPSGAETA